MILLNPVLKKLHIESLAVPNRGVFLKTILFVKWNNTKFPNVSSHTHTLYTAHTLHCLVGYFLLSPVFNASMAIAMY